MSQTIVKHSTWGQCPQVLAGTARKIAKSTRLCSYTGFPFRGGASFKVEKAHFAACKKGRENQESSLLVAIVVFVVVVVVVVAVVAVVGCCCCCCCCCCCWLWVVGCGGLFYL